MKLGHIGLSVRNVQKSKQFYDSFAGLLGLKFMDEFDGFVGYGDGESYRFYIHDESRAMSGLHLCFEVKSRKDVDAFYEVALEVGGKDNGAPGVRENYSSTYYAAFVLDPDGNNIEAVCHNL